MRRLFAIGTTAVFVAALSSVILAGSLLSSPSRRHVGEPPAELDAVSVSFESESGATVSAWYGQPDGNRPVVILSHGVRGARDQLQERAVFLREAGYGVLLYDAQAHGESTGDHITFGFLESLDARAAANFVSRHAPRSSIGFVGPSLAGASALLGPSQLPVDALVLEAVYPTLESAVFNRISMRTTGPIAELLTPLLLIQVEPRLGFDPYALNPIDRISTLTIPVLVIAGSEDQHTTLTESKALYEAVQSPKDLWIVEGAKHQSFHEYAKSEYEFRLKSFFGRHLSTPRRITRP